AALSAFSKWDGYVNAALDSFQNPALDELLFFSCVGLLARRPIEVRSLLRRPQVRAVIKALEQRPGEQDWPENVRRAIGTALLSLVQQADHKDVSHAAELMRVLAVQQGEIEGKWLTESADSSRDALELLCYYHVAQAVIRTSEFLLVGTVERDGRQLSDFAPELGRLLVKAEDYLAASGDAELSLWLKAASLMLLQLRIDSIWVSGMNISERIDQLIRELTREGREHPIFSLLPSQHDALRQRLPDPTQVAVVLQMPTSAGKTLLAEFAMLQTFEAYKDGTRIVYVTPTRALATQVRRTLAEDLGP